MKIRSVAILLVFVMLFLAGCGPEKEVEVESIVVTETKSEPETKETEAETVPEDNTAAEPEKTTPAADEEKAPEYYFGKVYQVFYGTGYEGEYETGIKYYIDSEGNQLQRSAIAWPVEDVTGGEPRYYYIYDFDDEAARETFDSGIVTGGEKMPTEDGKKQTLWTSVLLVDADGNVLMESEYGYYCSLGTLVAVESGKGLSYLCDPATGEKKLEGFTALIKLNGDTVLVQDGECELSCIIGPDGAVIAECADDLQCKWPEVYREYIVGHNTDDRILLKYTDGAFEKADGSAKAFPCVHDCDENGGFLVWEWEDDDYRYHSKVYDLNGYKFLCEINGSVKALDGQRMITADNKKWYVRDMSGEKLFGPYDHLCVSFDRDKKKPFDVIYASKDDVLFALDSDGSELASVKIRGLNYFEADRDGLHVTYFEKDSGETAKKSLQLDAKLKEFIPDAYSSYRYVTDSVGCLVRTDPLEQCDVYDLCDTSGKIIMHSAEAYGTADERAIAVIRGGEAGLIDSKGNWIGSFMLGDYDK